MKKINFLMGIHNHQPIGNFEFVFENAFNNSYKPFIDLLLSNPEIKMNIHFTGILLEWIEKNRTDYFENIRTLVKRNQIEILTGGYYEPIMPLIPHEDRVAQIKKLTAYIEKHFNYKPTGMWLAERVWEQGLVGSLVEAGVKYVVLDDSHFINSGILPETLNSYFLTEDQGQTLKLIPIDKKSRYLIPFDTHEKVMEYFLEKATDDGKTMLTMADDGEKFGDWPGTYNSVYEKGWLQKFYTLISENSGWIKIRLFSEFIQNSDCNGIIYLNNASYNEMMEWSLSTHMQREVEYIKNNLKGKEVLSSCEKFLGRGFFRNFLYKYSEANNMHKKMLHVHEKIRSMEPGEKQNEALDYLMAGQCNCPYWHGVFGGLYLPHLRHAIYENLIKAEKLADSSNGKQRKVEITEKDFDFDGYKEVLMSNNYYNLYFDLKKGATLFEEDIKPVNYNLLNTLMRRKESYHQKLIDMIREGRVTNNPTDSEGKIVIKEDNLDKVLNYDWYRRNSLIDHFFHPDTTPESFASVIYGEQGDFVTEPYDYNIKIATDGSTSIEFFRDGHVWVDGIFEPVNVTKVVSFKNENIVIDYKIKNLSDKKLTLWHGVEFNLSMLGGHADDRYYYNENGKLENHFLDSVNKLNEQNMIGVKDDYMNIAYEFLLDTFLDIWTFPIETVSISESGFEKIYQSSVICFNQKITLASDEEFKMKITKKLVQNRN
ncbi:MAG: alpha-amylase/4-alpha-glucanotransferase domain-containing protein [Candidatus Muiribacteriota bacterium]